MLEATEVFARGPVSWCSPQTIQLRRALHVVENHLMDADSSPGGGSTSESAQLAQCLQTVSRHLVKNEKRSLLLMRAIGENHRVGLQTVIQKAVEQWAAAGEIDTFEYDGQPDDTHWGI